ncbi:MAG: site-specific integrase [Syntrophothermus sp.]|uniref:tyrosine-type recombinase/integrase n=1 Tax=Syntrophothermus sp. TaxID=2736299 RepID=UPI00257E8B85|nr:tyrosine-type recombinase/integrase [Syntrophothermus sp.]NSW82781.1 site-specific integrase [Syntrophothermus sp.]
MRTFFNYLYFNGKTVEALMYGVKRPRAENETEEAEFLSRADQKRLLMIRTSLDPHLAVRDRAIILLCLDAGLRLMEVQHLTWDDVDLDAKKVKLKDREVPFSGRLADALQELKIYSTSLYVAANQDTGKPLSPASITRIVKTAGELAGIADLNCNRLRQNHGLELAKKGIAIEEIGKLMGISARRAEWYYQEARRAGKKKERGTNSG